MVLFKSKPVLKLNLDLYPGPDSDLNELAAPYFPPVFLILIEIGTQKQLILSFVNELQKKNTIKF
jgi:hypothetical protein